MTKYIEYYHHWEAFEKTVNESKWVCSKCSLTRYTSSYPIVHNIPCKGDEPEFALENRPDWPNYFLDIAKQVSRRATCSRAMCGAVLVLDNRIVSTGYNGSPPGTKHCVEADCIMENGHCQRAIHAEVNAVVFAHQKLSGAFMYVYKHNLAGQSGYTACRECRKVMKAADINTIYWRDENYQIQFEKL